ncbi:mannose-6-phosphate isomerase-like [Teleopsis dalmanni]|uniref:mannose-6-phosphate isomerase-like n=1 Tax=Teleopsis dalmanni TaxID=139649 RepID=UPI0018CFEC59|nr:mannose-6-phosphate isomerase-like [Teleopsis dalmanni]XP_037950162.1 mannose-6-phosphate isomerase-like [Teleopsis dalmanni]
MELEGDIKTYEWGRCGSESVVAELAAINNKDFVIEPLTPYAELWMGDHESGPSVLKATGDHLGTILTKPLSFLFKVLSVKKALSIQVHPNKELAVRLHRRHPDIYKDDNHKPELAIAITDFTALCGFRPYEEIYAICQGLPPLKLLIGGDEQVETLQNADKEAAKKGLRKCFTKLMTSEQEAISACLDEISTNYVDVLKSHKLFDVFTTVQNDFPGDVGLLSLFFLNLLHLKPGDAIYLGANEIHAYLSGDCIEAMARSDNVIRAGLTPKFKDVSELTACLNYEGLPPSEKFFMPRRINEYIEVFAPPVDDFAIIKVRIPPQTRKYELALKPHSSILLTLHGKSLMRLSGHAEFELSRGTIIYIPPDNAPEIEFLSDVCGTEDLVVYITTFNCYRYKL